METKKQIKSALISVYHKEGLDEIIRQMAELNVSLFSTGGTLQYIKELGAKATAVEELTSYPSILGGRVKTLHPKIFGGILSRREVETDTVQLAEYEIPEIDLVIVDLYPFEETVSKGAGENEIIEKIDIGGISLIRAAAKNYNDVLIIPSRQHYSFLHELLRAGGGFTSSGDRKRMAMEAFDVTSHYDTAIFDYFNKGAKKVFKKSIGEANILRYGENPHQDGLYYGKMEDVFEKIQGKEISYNNLLDVDAALGLSGDFTEPVIAIFKHNNPCGVSVDENLTGAWKKALAGDPVSAFGGIVASNRKIDRTTAEEINKLFFEIILAPDYEQQAVEILKAKKNRIILKLKTFAFPERQFRSVLNGVLEQAKDLKKENRQELKAVTQRHPADKVIDELLFANKIVKHAKSNTIVLSKEKQLLGIGCGHVSRVDALKFAIDKAHAGGQDVRGAVMASDAFFPFSDCVEIAFNNGIKDIIQPGGSVRDNESIDFCNKHDMAMVFTGTRHFKH